MLVKGLFRTKNKNRPPCPYDIDPNEQAYAVVT